MCHTAGRGNRQLINRTLSTQTSTKEYVLVRSVKLIHYIKIRLITKIVEYLSLALFYILQIGEKEIFFDLDQKADHTKNPIDCKIK